MFIFSWFGFSNANPRYRNFFPFSLFFLFFLCEIYCSLNYLNETEIKKKKKKDMLHVNLHRDMTIFLFFFLSLFNSFSRRISCFQKKLSFIFRPLLCPYHTGFQENLHNFAYPHISPTPVSLSLSLINF